MLDWVRRQGREEKVAKGWFSDWKDVGGNSDCEYFLAQIEYRTRDGFENLVQEMEKDGWKLFIKAQGFTKIDTREKRISLSLQIGFVPFERPKKH